MKIVLVDDSYLVRSIIKQLLESLGGFEVVGEGSNGQQAIELVKSLKPDLLLMDVNMPLMDGITATEIIMQNTPLPIVILTSEDISEVGFNALNKGALEVIPKPAVSKMNDPEFAASFKTVLENTGRFGSFRLNKKMIIEKTELTPPAGDFSSLSVKPSPGLSGGKACTLVVIGASTGGPSAVREVLKGLPGNFPVGILLSQHIEEGYDEGYARWLDEGTELTVRISEENDTIQPGTVLVAPSTYHLCCTKQKAYWDDSPKLQNQKPSVDKMFFSAAASHGSGVIGVLLTGMGRDGADGCLKILQSGGRTLVQDRETSLIYGMPKAAAELNAATKILPLQKISSELKEMCGL